MTSEHERGSGWTVTPTIEYARRELRLKIERHSATIASSLRSTRNMLAREESTDACCIANMQTYLAAAMEAATAKEACEFALSLIDNDEAKG